MCAIATAIYLYSFGWAGSWHLDDEPNLQKLGLVFAEGTLNLDAAIDFVFSGNAGPLGRPIALLSFLMDGSGWPQSTADLLYTNSLLHVLNGLLLCAVLLQAGWLQGLDEEKNKRLAVSVATLWVFSPMLASCSLMAVQRMTVLASTFMLMGLWLYLVGRRRLNTHFGSGLMTMVAGLGLGTLMGIFTKEQAALLPLLVWVLDSCLLPKPVLSKIYYVRRWRMFKVAMFYLPASVVASYLLRVAVNADAGYAARDFSLTERVSTQLIILWDYLRLSFLPRAISFGPFHDDYPVFAVGVMPVVAGLAWFIVFFIAYRVRRTTRLPLFAVLWYWSAQILESTVVPLELYFEHRNYLALIGPLYALTAGLWHWAEMSSNFRLAGLVFGGYVVLQAGILFQITSLFGQSAVAAEMWYQQHPGSLRASQYLAQKMVDRKDVRGALNVLDQTAAMLKDPAVAHLQGLQLGCSIREPAEKLRERLMQVKSEIAAAKKNHSITKTLVTLGGFYRQKICSDVIDQNALEQLAQAGLSNDKISGNAKERSDLNLFAATIFMESRDFSKSMHYLEAAINSNPSIENLTLTVAILQSAGLYEEALNILNMHPMIYPKNPVLRSRFEREWIALRDGAEEKLKEHMEN